MPGAPTPEQRIEWHLEHKKHCECGPVPEKLAKEIKDVTKINPLMIFSSS